MSTITITLPESLQEFVTDQVLELGLTAPEEYIEKLVREEQKNQLWAYYEKEVGKAIDQNIWHTEEEFWKKIYEKREQRKKEQKLNKENNDSH